MSHKEGTIHPVMTYRDSFAQSILFRRECVFFFWTASWPSQAQPPSCELENDAANEWLHDAAIELEERRYVERIRNVFLTSLVFAIRFACRAVVLVQRDDGSSHAHLFAPAEEGRKAKKKITIIKVTTLLEWHAHVRQQTVSCPKTDTSKKETHKQQKKQFHWFSKLIAFDELAQADSNQTKRPHSRLELLDKLSHNGPQLVCVAHSLNEVKTTINYLHRIYLFDRLSFRLALKVDSFQNERDSVSRHILLLHLLAQTKAHLASQSQRGWHTIHSCQNVND